MLEARTKNVRVSQHCSGITTQLALLIVILNYNPEDQLPSSEHGRVKPLKMVIREPLTSKLFAVSII